VSGFRNEYRIPFRLTPRRAPLLSALIASIVRPTCLGAAFACGLGSTHPCASAVHMEPFSTSVLEGLTRVFATTTKICTDGGSRRAHAPTPSTLTATPPYSPGRTGP
jgi:hypothetical protein